MNVLASTLVPPVTNNIKGRGFSTLYSYQNRLTNNVNMLLYMYSNEKDMAWA